MEELIYHKPQSEFYNGKNINNGYISGGDDLPFIRFRCFEKSNVDAVLSTRIGGVSTGCYSSLNLDFDRQEDYQNILVNYERVAKALDVKTNRMAKAFQVHKTHIEHIKPDTKIGILNRFDNTDGFFTNLPRVVLCAGAADCTPIFLADKTKGNIALVHSGWRGTVGRIGAKAVKKLEVLGSDPKDIIALIGPSISRENYEVTEEVIEAFRSAGFSDAQMKDIAEKTDNIHYHLDIWAGCYYGLTDAKILPENIFISGICTYENPNLFYSHRYCGDLRGGMNAFMFLKSHHSF